MSKLEVSKEEQHLAALKLNMIHIPRERTVINEITTDSLGFTVHNIYVPTVVLYDIRIDFSLPIPLINDQLPEPQQNGDEAIVVRLPLLYSPAFSMPTCYDEIEYLYHTIELRDDNNTGVSNQVIHTSNLYSNCPILTLTEKEQQEARQYLDLQLKSKGMTCDQLLREERERMCRKAEGK